MSGPQGLLFTEIKAFFDESEIEGAYRRRCFRFVQALDVAYLNHSYEKIERRHKARENKKPRG